MTLKNRLTWNTAVENMIISQCFSLLQLEKVINSMTMSGFLFSTTFFSFLVLKQNGMKIRLGYQLNLWQMPKMQGQRTVFFTGFAPRNFLESQLFWRGLWVAHAVALAPGHLTAPAAAWSRWGLKASHNAQLRGELPWDRGRLCLR